MQKKKKKRQKRGRRNTRTGGGVTSTCPGEFREIIWQAQRYYWHRHGQRIRKCIWLSCDESFTSCCWRDKGTNNRNKSLRVQVAILQHQLNLQPYFTPPHTTSKTKYAPILWPSNSNSEYIPKRYKKYSIEIRPPKDMKMFTHLFIISPNWKQSKSQSTIELIKKFVYIPWNITQYEKEQTNANCKNMSDPHRHNVEEKKTSLK